MDILLKEYPAIFYTIEDVRDSRDVVKFYTVMQRTECLAYPGYDRFISPYGTNTNSLFWYPYHCLYDL